MTPHTCTAANTATRMAAWAGSLSAGIGGLCDQSFGVHVGGWSFAGGFVGHT